MFKSRRAVRRGFKILGYAINPHDHEVPSQTIRQFQRDYNKCSDRFNQWGNVEVGGSLDIDTLNALEHAVRWSRKRENSEGIPSARFWQSLCADLRPELNYKRAYAQTEPVKEKETNFVEVLPNGIGKLRNIYTDDALRCNILAFERHGDVIFAIVEVPPQGDLPNGRDEQINCPCIFAR